MKKPNARRKLFKQALNDPAMRRRLLRNSYHYRNVGLGLMIFWALDALFQLFAVLGAGWKPGGWGMTTALLGLAAMSSLHATYQERIAAFEACDEIAAEAASPSSAGDVLPG